jgi:hypothetical protein
VDKQEVMVKLLVEGRVVIELSDEASHRILSCYANFSVFKYRENNKISEEMNIDNHQLYVA